MEEEQDEEQPEDNDNEENAPEEGEQDQKAGEVLFKSEEGEGERSEERRVGKECRIGCRSRWSAEH